MSRAGTIWDPGTVPYSQSTLHQPDGYRQDCSGYVSMCWMLPLNQSWGGESTVTLVTEGWMTEISRSELLPGDAIGLCGPGTAGNAGHIQLVEKFDAATGLLTIWEQAGGTMGPIRRSIRQWPSGYKAYRFKGITNDVTGDDDKMYWAVSLKNQEQNGYGVWLGDGLTRRPMHNQAEIEFYLKPKSEGGPGAVRVYDVDPVDLDSYGVVIADVVKANSGGGGGGSDGKVPPHVHTQPAETGPVA